MDTVTSNRARVFKGAFLLVDVMQVHEGWVAAVWGLPGCATQGETHEEVLEAIKDAYQGFVEVHEDLGEELVWEADHEPWGPKSKLEWVKLH